MTVTKGKRRLNLLVIDDDELDRLAVRRCVQQSSLDSQADPVGSAAEAFQRDLARYDCILLDYYLPGEDGLETLQRIRETAPHVPVVIFTGHGDEDIAVELMKAGAADYLPKASLTPERLEAAIRHALHVTGTAEARERAEGRLRLLSEAAQHLLTANEPDELLQGLWQRVQEPLGVDAWFNVAQDRRGRAPRVTASGGLSAEVVASLDKAVAAADTPAPLAHDETVRINHLEFSDEPWLRTLQEDGIRACICHPLYAGGIRLGTLCFATRRKDEFAPDEVDFLRTVSHYATIAYERLKHIEAMRGSERRKDEFLATLAHELRDPLAPLANVVELMKLAANGDAVLERARRTMDRQLRQLVRLVDDLLDVARITGGQLKLRKRHVKLAAPLRHAIETIQPLVDAAGQALEVELPDEDIWVNGDRARLTQVFGNLLTNASKFSEPGARICLSASREGSEAVVRVVDTGIGIPAEELGAIFGMFTQVLSGRERPHNGLGIGLALASRLVEMHGGEIEARSDGRGKGSEFVVRLPTVAAPGEARRPMPGKAAPVEGHRILIVDDNRDSATTLATLLRLTGHETSEAYDGPQALAAADEFRPDVVLLDIGLPGLDGYSVCRRLRAEPWGRDMLIIAVSGWGKPEDQRRSAAAGFDHHMVKPIKHDALTALLGGSAARQGKAAG